MLPIPDLLHLEPRQEPDQQALLELLELSFLGKDVGDDLDRQLGNRAAIGGWDASLFTADLFVDELIRDSFKLEIDGRRFPVNTKFLRRVLCDPPVEIAAIRFRQDILRELDDDPELLASAHRLYFQLFDLLVMFKTPEHAAQLDINTFRLDLLRQARQVIVTMVEGFGSARSGLRRLHDVGRRIQDSEEYQILVSFLDYESSHGALAVRIGVGADGRVRHLEITGIEEHRDNRFYKPPLGRLLEKLKLFFWHGYQVTRADLVHRLLREVFLQIKPALTPLVQLVGQLEVYLTSRAFRDAARRAGLEMSLARFAEGRPIAFSQLFNPLLMKVGHGSVPTSIRCHQQPPMTLITGPNSGGKTRLLQAIGLAQLLGQSGLYTTAAAADLTVVAGLFVSLVEREAADQAEGRLGREMLRIRSLFESMRSPSMVILDELCSGTNPSEGIEIFRMVLGLLDRLTTISFISTHFLELARQLEAERPFVGLEFLQVEIDDRQASTYQFLTGVAASSLATVTAERLGVSFDELLRLIDEHRQQAAQEGPSAAPVRLVLEQR